MKGDYPGEFEEIVLLAVRRLGDAATGSAVQALLEREAGRRAALGAIYAVLDRAERKGWTESWLGEALPEPGGRRRRHYGLTRSGESTVEESRRVRNALWQRSPRPAR